MISIRHVASLAALAFLGCRAENAIAVLGPDAPTHSVSVRLGTEVRRKLQTIGPGEYRNPPTISSPSLRFEGVVLAGPYVPAGVTQEFRFKAVAKGQAVVTFTHTENGPTIEDTVNVR